MACAPKFDVRPIIEDGPVHDDYKTVWCPKREEYRCSFLCEEVCADTVWSETKRNEQRKDCPVWSELKNRSESS